MMKHEEMIALIDDVFLGAYMAGQAADMSSIERARADRGCLIDEVADLYAELEHESYEREQFQIELNKANKRIDGMKKFYHFYGSKLTDPDEYLKREV